MGTINTHFFYIFFFLLYTIIYTNHKRYPILEEQNKLISCGLIKDPEKKLEELRRLPLSFVAEFVAKNMAMQAQGSGVAEGVTEGMKSLFLKGLSIPILALRFTSQSLPHWHWFWLSPVLVTLALRYPIFHGLGRAGNISDLSPIWDPQATSSDSSQNPPSHLI